jgi:hypothetical protein
MKKALIMKLIILLFALSLSACATVHKVNIDAIEANKNKTFTIGIIKVTGSIPFPFGDDVDKKITVLQKVPIKEICDVLFANYGINVNPDFNKTIRTVEGEVSGRAWIGPLSFTIRDKNPYWGNKEYEEPGFLSGPTIIGDDSGDTISITYSFRSGQGLPWALKDIFYYEVTVKSDAEVLVQHMGEIATVDMPKKGLFLDLEGVWNDVTTYVEKIPEALARDIKAMK